MKKIIKSHDFFECKFIGALKALEMLEFGNVDVWH